MEALVSLLSNMTGSLQRATSAGKKGFESDKKLKSGFCGILNSTRNQNGVCVVSGNNQKESRKKKKNVILQTAPLVFDSNIMKEILSTLVSQMNAMIAGDTNLQANDCKLQVGLDNELLLSQGEPGKILNGNLSNLQQKTPGKPDGNNSLRDLNRENNKNNLELLSTNKKLNFVEVQKQEILSTDNDKQADDSRPDISEVMKKVEILATADTRQPGDSKENRRFQPLQSPAEKDSLHNLSVKTGNIDNQDKMKMIPDEKHSDNSRLEFQYIKKFNNNDRLEKLQADPEVRIEDRIEETSVRDIKHLDEVIVKTYSPGELSTVTNAKEENSVGVRMSDLTEKLAGIMTRFSNQEANNREIVEIKLEPPRLGKVSITLQMENEVLRTDFVCSRESAEYIRESIPELVSSLAENGIVLGESNINMGWGRSPEDSGRNKWESDNHSDDKSTIVDVDSEDTVQIVGESRYSFLI